MFHDGNKGRGARCLRAMHSFMDGKEKVDSKGAWVYPILRREARRRCEGYREFQKALR